MPAWMVEWSSGTLMTVAERKEIDSAKANSACLILAPWRFIFCFKRYAISY